MITVYFYDTSTGIIRPKPFKTTAKNSADLIALNTPTGHRPIFGVTDSQRQRVDVATGEIVACDPIRNKFREVSAARSRISDLEVKQARRVRELLLGTDQQLQAIDAEIAELRKVINDSEKT